MEKEKKIMKIRKDLETLSSDMSNIIGCVETIENSLFFSSERTDKDMTKPCALCLEVVITMRNYKI